MTHDQAAAELSQAVDDRMAERIEDARRRRERRAAYRTAKNQRRTAGLRARHHRKLNRNRGDRA